MISAPSVHSGSDLLNSARLCVLALLLATLAFTAHAATCFRYFYDDANELYRVLDSTGTLIEYTYDASGNITNIARSTLPAAQLSILNVAPANSITGAKLTIMGQNFSAIAAGDTVMIGGLPATVISATATQLVVLVPPGTTGGAISVTVGGVTATWSGSVAVTEIPVITSISPASGKAGATVTVTVTGADLSGATFTLQSVDPADTNPGATITVLSNAGTVATLSLVLGTTQGQFALVGTNAVGTGAITPASVFIIGLVNNSVSFYASVLNTSYNPVTNPPFPPGHNSVNFSASVLNTSYNPVTNPPLPAGRNTLSYYASVLNISDNTVTNPPFPPGQNSLSSYASVLNTSYNPAANPPLPPGRNTVSYYLSVCNTASGCTATPSAILAANASATSLRLRRPASLPRSPSQGLLPILEPVETITSVISGQTIRLAARNVDPGSIVEFDVNRATAATVGEEPYETLFTVPDGSGDLVFQVIVRSAGQPERVSQVTRMTVAPDDGAAISGSVMQAAGQNNSGVELSLAAGGLKSEFFRLDQPVTNLPSLDGLQPVRAGYVTAINEPNPAWAFGGDPLGTHLGSDYAVRFSGEVRADTTGQYRFWLAARSGAALFIDGSLRADTGFTSGEPVETATSVSLDNGWHSINIIYYLGVGNSSVRLDWQQPGGLRREALGPEYLRTTLTAMEATSAADGTFTFTQVPKRFDTVWIRARQGDNLIEFPAVAPGAGPVLIEVSK